MKTLLIYPPFIRLHGISYRFFPIGLGYLAGALRSRGRDVAIYNAEIHAPDESLVSQYTYSDNYRLFQQYQDALDDPGHPVWQEAERVMRDYRPDIVGLSVKSCMVPSAQILSRIAKRVNPDIAVVWGGPHPSIVPDETIGYEAVDFVVRHEGEHTMVEFVDQLERAGGDWRDHDWSSVHGLVWKNGAVPVTNLPRQNDEHLDEMQVPDKTTVLFPERYDPDHYGVMFTARGCPWPCTFCDSRGVWTRSIRYRTPANVVREMEALYEKQGVRNFLFWDDTFTPNKKLSMELFDLIIERFQRRGRPITWQATTRCDCVDDELAAKMKESGCQLLTFGIESGSPTMMQILKKGITHDKVKHCQRVLRKADIEWQAFFMIGFPDDTAETIEETMQMIRSLDVVTCISIFTPYPNTEMYDRAREYGLLEEPLQWRYYSHQSPMNHFVGTMSKEEFMAISERCLAEVDRLNARLYYKERLRHYLSHPQKIPGYLLRQLGNRLRRRRRGPAQPPIGVGVGNLPSNTQQNREIQRV